MPHIYLCFVWHMHQPFYKDLVSCEYRLPWARMHALKDYYGMVKILDEFPEVHQTFNLVPSMLAQIEDCLSDTACDPFLRVALKPAEQLTEQEQAFILQYFFQANPARMVYRYPRYGELYDRWQSGHGDVARTRRLFDTQALRDLQVLSQLAWFDEEFLTGDPEVRSLVARQRSYTLEHQQLMGRKQLEIMRKVIPVYREFAARGQIEISTTPFYHPILPLLCDSNIAEVSHPYVPLPARFRYPQDARQQLVSACDYMAAKMGQRPTGLWPSEGAVSDEVLGMAADLGFHWAASDNGILARTLNVQAGPDLTYQPYIWRLDGRELRLIFRDHYLSDLIGFVYARMPAAEAAGHFLGLIRQNCAGILAGGRDALVPIILDGENAWEYYEESGRPFLRELYRRISEDRDMTALTVSEALERFEPATLDHVFPGSWINANFDIWIGAEEDNKAWEYLLRARQTCERVLGSPEAETIPDDRKRLALDELMIAEGSDWCWWYGPEHDSANRAEFDQLFRDHVANVYLAMRLSPPEELSRPIVRLTVKEVHQHPTGPVRATIDGRVTSYFEWLGAGMYRVDGRTGAMHGHRFFISELRYGSDGHNLYVRLDFVPNMSPEPGETELRINVRAAGEPESTRTLQVRLNDQRPGIEAAFATVSELKLALPPLGISPLRTIEFQLSLWQCGLPMDALPPQGWIELSTAEPVEW